MIIGSKIALADVPPEMLKSMKKALSLHNPAYGQALKRNPHARIFLSPKITYYTEKNGVFFCGRGLEDRVHSYAEHHNIELEWYERTVKPVYESRSSIVLRPYQEGVPETIAAHDHGIIKLATGFGKSLIALKLHEIQRTTTLIIVPKKSILGQFVKDVEKYFGFTPGIFGGGKKNIQPLTIATMQSLQNALKTMDKENKRIMSEYFGMIICDEVHGATTKKARQVIESFTPRYLYGMSATPFDRSDEQGEALKFIFGPVLVDKDVERKTPTVKVVKFEGKIPAGEYHDSVSDQINDYERNKLIASLVAQEVALGRKCLTITKRVLHSEMLYGLVRDLLPEMSDRIIILSSTGSAEARASELDDLRSGRRDFSVILGTMQLTSTGVDIPMLSSLVLAGDLKSRLLSIQSFGRILRLFGDKADPVIVDVWDTGNPYFRKQGLERQKFYRENKWKVEGL